MGFKVVKKLIMGPGLSVNICVNEDEPEGSIDRVVADTIYTGESSAEPLYVPPHWHKHHTEHFEVLEGRVQATINGQKITIKPGDPDMIVPKRAVHSLQGFKGERMVLREKASPGGEYKALFFNDLLSTGSLSNIPHLLRAFYDGDTYLALPLYFRFLDEVFLTVVGGVAHLFAAAKPTGGLDEIIKSNSNDSG